MSGFVSILTICYFYDYTVYNKKLSTLKFIELLKQTIFEFLRK